MTEKTATALVFGQFAEGRSKPLMAMFEVANRCNMDCPVCFSDANHPAHDVPFDQATHEFLNNSKHVQVDPEQTLVRLSKIFRFYTADFVNVRIAPSMIDYVNRYRETTIPESFSVEFIACDWTVNSVALHDSSSTP